MGNSMGTCYSCCYMSAMATSAKLVFWEGTTRLVTGKCLAGEIMFQFPDRIVCHADSFYIGHRVPALAIDDELVMGQTYFVIPVDQFSGEVLSSKSVASLAASACHRKGLRPIKFSGNPFQCGKAADGGVLIKVSAEFLMRVLTGSKEGEKEEGILMGSNDVGANMSSPLCSTPELQKHYDMLVGSKGQVWSPTLETITENGMKTRRAPLSPYKLLGLDWRSEKMIV